MTRLPGGARAFDRWRSRTTKVARCAAVALALLPVSAFRVGAQDALPSRPFLDSIAVPPLAVDPLEVTEYEVGGVTVFHTVDPALPLVDVLAHFGGGYARLPREMYAAGTALPALLSSGGSLRFDAQEVDRFTEGFAVQLSYGGSGPAVTSSMNVLEEHLDSALVVWGSVLREPAFDPDRIELWVGRERESVRRRADDPGALAFSEYNRLMYGDHPIGWEMTLDDLVEVRTRPEVFREVHRRILCPENLTLGVVGRAPFEEIRPRVERLLDGWPPCTHPLPDAPLPDRVGVEPGVYLIPKTLDQAVIVSTQVVDLPQGDTPEYFASRLGNTILGGGGLSSRLNQTLRTRLGLTYGAASVWTTPRRYPGLLGGTTRVRPDGVVEALRAMHGAIDEMALAAPSAAELEERVAEYEAGWVFNFRSPREVLSRRIGFRVVDLPDDWLHRFRDGMRAVTPEAVRAVFDASVREDAWVTLIVGDPEVIGSELAEFGPVTVLEVG